MFGSTFDTHCPMAKLVCICEVFAVPGQVLSSHPNAPLFPVKTVQFAQVAEHNITQFSFIQRHFFRAGFA